MTVLAQVAEGATAGANTAEIVLFWIFGVVALGAALAVITMRNIVHGALMLVLNFLAVAGLYVTLQSSFLAIIQVLVYAGAIMVLFLFVIMLLGVDRDDLLLATDVPTRVLAVAGGTLLVGALLFAFVGPFTGDGSICGAADSESASSTAVPCAGLDAAYAEDDQAGAAFLGGRMFTRYAYPFELAAVLLTVATIGAVVLARRRDLESIDEEEPVPEPGPEDEGADQAELPASTGGSEGRRVEASARWGVVKSEGRRVEASARWGVVKSEGRRVEASARWGVEQTEQEG